MALKSVEGNVVDGDDMHWTAECPNCEHETEWRGI